MGVGRLQTHLDLFLDEPQLLDVITAVDPLTAIASGRNDQLVTVLPRAQGLRGNAKHLGHRADAVDPCRVVASHHQYAAIPPFGPEL